MNALIAFRSNALGNMTPTRSERRDVAQELTANLRMLRNRIKPRRSSRTAGTNSGGTPSCSCSSSKCGSKIRSTRWTTRTWFPSLPSSRPSSNRPN